MDDSRYKHVIVALPCEARPFIDHYKLHSVVDFPGFRCYAAADLRLVVSGMGKLAAAAAVAACHAYFRNRADQVWLNIGIGGHGELTPGTVVLAGKITDRSTGRSWYPPILHDHGLPVHEICTVDVAETAYPCNAVYDMEAAGFYDAAMRFSTAELVQCVKVISDNKTQGIERVDAVYARELVTEQLPVLEGLLQQLWQCAGEIAPDPAFQVLLQQLTEGGHFSVYQQRQLEKLTRRFLARGGSQEQLVAALGSMTNSKKILQLLQQQIDSLPYELVSQ